MKHPWMPLFWGDFLANTLHLTANEIGAYFLLIAHAWEHDGTIPLKRAQTIARIDNRNWRRIWPRLEPFFELEQPVTSDPSPVLRHRRVTVELSHAAEISNKRKGAAMQMHQIRRANASVLHPLLHMHPPSQSLTESSVVSSQSNGRANSPAASTRPQPTAAWHPRVDEADDYRAPPAKKSDNILQPIPDKPERRQ